MAILLFILTFPVTWQFTWSDGALAGNEAILWLATDDAKPEEQSATRFRLAGLEGPESTGDGITHELFSNSVLSLANLTSGSIYAQITDLERVYLTTDGAPALTTRYIGFVYTLVGYQPNTNNPLWEDAGFLMLRAGRVRLSRMSALEVPAELYVRYQAAEAEARANRRGWWRYEWLMPPMGQVERRPDAPAPLPQRNSN